MAQFQRHFVQELTKPLIVRQCGDLGFSGDNLSDVISVDLYTDGEPYSGGGTCAGACICPDGSTVALTGSVSGKTASVTLKDDCFAIPGQIGIGIRVTSGTIKTTVLKCIYNVDLFATNNPVDPGSRITLDVGDLVNRIDAATADIPASDMASLMAGIAPTFSATTAYPAGAYVYYNGTLYRFTATHAAGSWTGTDATAVALGNDVADLKSALTQDHIINYVDFSGSTADHFISDNGTYTEAQNYSVSQPFHVLKGQKVFFTARGYSNWISMISKHSNSVYTPLVISTGSTVTTYSYTATEDMDVVLSYRTEDLHECVFGYDLNDVYQKIANNIDSTLLKENMSAESSVVGNYILAPANIDFTGSTTGKFIYKNGTVYDNENFSYTNSFTAKPGDKITVKITGYEDNVSVISEKIGSEFVPCVISESSTEQEYTYEVEHIGQYVICYRTANTHTGYITSDILSTFRDWKKLPYIEMFTNMAGLGDSLMSGAAFKGSSGYDCKNYSWLSMLARSIGAKWYCYSQGGYTTKDWLSGGYKTMFENAEELPDCVFIAFGTNDRNNQSTIPTGTSSDTSTSETFCGYYKKIIELVHTKTPGAIIFCCSLYDNSDASSVQYSSLVYEIVKQYAYCHFIDIANNSKISRKVTNDYAEGDHFTTVGYLYIAELIKTLVNDAIQNDPADYKYLGYDNTSN